MTDNSRRPQNFSPTHPTTPLRSRREANSVIATALVGLLIATAHGAIAAGESNQTAAKDASTLEIVIEHLESDRGVVIAVLLDSAEQYDSGDQFFQSDENVPIRDGRASVTFENVPFGTYAVKIFHDENANGKLDTNFVGFPKEGFGFSNDAMGKFGPPTFAEAAFAIDSLETRIEINAN